MKRILCAVLMLVSSSAWGQMGQIPAWPPLVPFTNSSGGCSNGTLDFSQTCNLVFLL